MANWTYDEAAYQLTTTGGGVTWGSATVKARLVISSVTPARTDTSMTGYTAATGSTDQTLGSKTVTKDTTNHRIVFDAADSTFTAVASGSTVGYFVVYKFVTNDAGSTPLFLVDITDTPTNGSDFVITWPATGIGYIQN